MTRKKEFSARFKGICSKCKGTIEVGEPITWTRKGERAYYHARCRDITPEPAPRDLEVTAAPTTVPTPTSDLGKMLAEAVKPHLDSKCDRAEVEAIVEETVEKLHVPTLTIEISSPDRDTITIEGAHKDFKSVLDMVQLGRSVGFCTYMHGLPGAGKSTIGKQVADALGLPFYLLTLAPMSPPSALVGYGTADGNYVESDAYKAYTKGGVLMVEEVDNANDGVLTAFNAAIANGHGSWPVVGTVERHPDFVLIAAGNTPGLGPTRSFPARRRLDAAFRDRFVFHTLGYDLDLEKRLTLAANRDASDWLTWCRNLRAWAEANAPELFVTPRSTVFGASLLTLKGMTWRKAADAAIFRGVEEDIKKRAFAAHPCKAPARDNRSPHEKIVDGLKEAEWT